VLNVKSIKFGKGRLFIDCSREKGKDRWDGGFAGYTDEYGDCGGNFHIFPDSIAYCLEKEE
jgi:hypothetical protein